MQTIVRSVTRLLPFALLLLLAGCTKKSDPDPRDQYVGTWTETTYNGKAFTPPADVITLAKGTASTDINLTSANFLGNGQGFALTLGTSGVQATNTAISSGLTYTFSDNSKGPILFKNLKGTVAGNQLTLTYTLYAESATKVASGEATEVFAKN